MRYYHDGLGRFVNRDPIGYGAAANLYQYVGGHPHVSVDPYGTEPEIVDSVKVGFGYGFYWGMGWSIRITASAEEKACCLPNGKKSTKEKGTVEAVGEYGVGIGFELDFVVESALNFEIKGPQARVRLAGTCESPCGGTMCCKVCSSVGLDVGVLGLHQITVGVVSFGVEVTGKAELQLKQCYNFGPGCARTGYAMGICSDLDITAELSYLFVSKAFHAKSDFQCHTLIGTTEMLKE
jgi:hypothetical protein